MVLAFLHTGAFGLIRYWLRSQRVTSSTLVGGLPGVLETKYHLKILEVGDRLYGFDGVPHTFGRWGALRDAVRFLRPGHVLIIALDGGRLSAESERNDADGLPILAKRGACRMAAQTNAIVIPTSVRRTGPCRFELRFGEAVPDELIQKKDFDAATQHLISELWRDIKEDPGELNWTTLEALAPALRKSRTGWP